MVILLVKLIRYVKKKLTNNEKILDLILESENVEVPSKIGLDQTHIYCTRIENFKTDELKKLFKNGTNINASINMNSPIFPGFTPLHIAALFNVETVILLVREGADLFVKDKSGTTPLDTCIKNFNSVDISRILKSCKYLENIKLYSGKTLADVVAKFESTDELQT